MVVATVFHFGLIASVVALFWGSLTIWPLENLLLGLAKWVLPAAVVGGVLAFFFPKVMLCIVYPFSIFGFGDVEVT